RRLGVRKSVCHESGMRSFLLQGGNYGLKSLINIIKFQRQFQPQGGAMLDSLEVISRQQLLGFPAADTMVVTVNNRMAIHLKKELISVKRHEAQVFELAQVQPWSHFLEFLYER